MLTATDSFIEYLSSGLSNDPKVYWWRQSAYEEHSGLLQHNAVNVQYLGFFEEGSVEYCLTSLDLLADDERQALTWLKKVRDLLVELQTIPEMDYSNPSSPVETGRSVAWDGQFLRFHNVRTPRGALYVHYNATFPIYYTRE